MELVMIDGLWTLKLDMIATLALATLLLLFGRFLVKRVRFLATFCIPAPVVGGLLFSLLTLFLHYSKIFAVSMTTTFQTPFMLAFFTCIGLIASLRLVKSGGKLLFFYWGLCGFIALAQNVIGVTLSEILNIHPLLGVLMGAVSMEGGHGGAGAFGPEVEALGIPGATAVAIAAATFGLVAGGLLGGPVARHLITKHDLHPTEDLEVADHSALHSYNEPETVTSAGIFTHISVITICITIGLVITSYVKNHFGIAIPNYVGSMFLAVFFRNINDAKHLVKLENTTINLIGDVSLGIFLSMALMTLRLWELADLAIPMVVILFAQVIFMAFYTLFVAFPIMGKTYDAAIICAGMAGHGLGATPNAMANMTAVTEKFGPSTKAFLIVPLCGSFLIDLFGVPCIVWFINMFQ